MSRGKLLDPAVCRVFFSSPFNGMEGEREELTRRWWPQLESICRNKGVKFVPVDMRWGITPEQSNTSQTINICLREIDRSDVFVGFFGQRYGWHGLKDDFLQRTFDSAIPRYPWLENFRDRSVTELEFLHGHLNEPGKLPAVICFRDKQYDEKWQDEARKTNDQRLLYKYSSESDLATRLMDDLKARVELTKDSCLAVNMAYPTPVEGAQWMFNAILDYVTKTLLKPPDSKQTVRHAENAQHQAFFQTMCASYHSDGCYFDWLDSEISKDDNQVSLVLGEPGIGKSTLLSNWIKNWKKNHNDIICVYHFVGCTASSIEYRNILQRIISNIRHNIDKILKEDAYVESEQEDLNKLSDLELTNECARCMQAVVAMGRKAVIVIDDLEKIHYREKIARPLYWLPTIPEGLHVVLSTSQEDTATIEELTEYRKTSSLQLKPLTDELKMKICRDILMQRGKELSGNQLQMIVDPEATSNPLFLRVLLEELCMFGKFRELDKKIESLVGCSDTTKLFEKFLQRLEDDYNPADFDGNLTEKVMCALWATRNGLTESDLTKMFDLQPHHWPPFYFAIESFIRTTKGGFLHLGRVELQNAVYLRYIKNAENEIRVLHDQIDYYQQTYQHLIASGSQVPSYFHTELLWLCFRAKDGPQLLKLITSVTNFTKLFEEQKYELLQYVEFFSYTIEETISTFSKSVDLELATMYADELEYLRPAGRIAEDFIQVLDTHALFFHLSKPKVEEHFLLRMKNILETSTQLSVEWQQDTLHSVIYRLACLYVDIKEYKKAYHLHLANIEYLVSKDLKSNIDRQQLGYAHHGYALVCMFLKKYDEALLNFKQSIEIHENLPELSNSKLNICQSLSSLAQLSAEQGDYESAVAQYEEVVKMENEIYIDTAPPEMAYSLTNLGICYRKVGKFDLAANVYQKALKIKVKALGENHIDIAYAYMNLANLALDKDDLANALAYFLRTRDIFRNVDFSESLDAAFASENAALVCLKMNDMEQGLPYFFEVFEYLSRTGQLEMGLKPVFEYYLRYLLFKKDYDKVREISKAMIGCESMRGFLPYLFLHYVDRLFPPEDNAHVSSSEESIDRALELYPDSQDLEYQKIELDLLADKNLEIVNDLLDSYHRHAEANTTNLTIQVADLCQQQGWLDGAIGIYKHGLERSGPSEAFSINLGICHAAQNQLSEALSSFLEAIKLNPDNPALKEKIVILSMHVGDLELCRHTIADLENRWPDDEALMKKLEPYKAELENLQ